LVLAPAVDFVPPFELVERRLLLLELRVFVVAIGASSIRNPC
jgi:hypothetical protein